MSDNKASRVDYRENFPYWRDDQQRQNFGDYLTEYLRDKLFLPIPLPPGDIRIIGSTLSDYHVDLAASRPTLPGLDAKRRLTAWGCGLRSETSLSDEQAAKVDILSVRGPLSASVLQLGSAIALGDPGLLLPALYTPAPVPSFQGKTVCVPHFHDTKTDAEIRGLTGADRVLRASLPADQAEIEVFIDRLTSADFVLCGAMHAAITACAYGIPFAYWDSGNIDLPFKWQDFSASVGIKCAFCKGLAEAREYYETEVKPKVSIPPMWAALAVAPLPLRPDALLQILRYELRRAGQMSLADIAEVEKVFASNRTQLSAVGMASEQHVDGLAVAVREKNTQLSELLEQVAELEQENKQIPVLLGQVKELTEENTQLSEQAKELTEANTRLSRSLTKSKEAAHSFLEGPVSHLVKAGADLDRLYRRPWRRFGWYFKRRALRFALLFQRFLGEKRVASFKRSLSKRRPRRYSSHWLTAVEQVRLASGFWVDGNYYNTPQPPASPQNLQQSLAEGPAALYSDIEPEAICFSVEEEPQVSVIIPVYGKIDYTLRCLHSVAQSPSRYSYEVIVVDDCSPDDNTNRLLRRVKGLRLISNESNLGFLRSVNKGCAAARGEYLLSLNNDTIVCNGWLDALRDTFDTFTDVGLVGSKLVYPNGVLQEAGGILWRDGSAWNYGNGAKDPKQPEYNYVREVDYCSGASIMIPARVFADMGGLDEHYAPAYCEDGDFALKVRQAGLRVLYQPYSQVVHFEGVTQGTDVTKGVKSYQVVNTKKLYERWQHRLDMFEERHQKNVARAKDRAFDKKVLVLDACTPTPDQDAGSVVCLNMMLMLREMGFQVTFIPDNLYFDPVYTPRTQRHGIEAIYGPYCPSIQDHLQEYGQRYDLVLIYRPQIASKYLALVRKLCKQAKIIYHAQDLHYLRMQRELEIQGNNDDERSVEKMQSIEMEAISKADAAILLSTVEIDILQATVPASKLNLLPLLLDIRHSVNPWQERSGILFVGGFRHVPNVDAICYFVEQVMPVLRARGLAVTLFIAGSNTPDEVLALAADDVKVLGFVQNLDELLAKVRLSVVPLRYGAGIKGKIGTSMAAGVPVISSRVGVEGMGLTEGSDFLLADSPEEYADALQQLYFSESLWQQLSARGQEVAEQKWGAEVSWRNMSQILAQVGFDVKRGEKLLRLYKG